MLTEFKRLMVLAPHPDDEAIGCGGTINRVVRDGGEAAVLYGTVPDAVRLAEAEAACNLLGAEMMAFSTHPSKQLDEYPMPNLVAFIEDAIQRWRPTALVLPHPDGFHHEHRAMAEAGVAATRPNGATGRHRPPVVAVYEEPFDCWVLTSTQTQFSPSLYVELEDADIAAKCAAMDAHASQVRPSPSERSTQALLSMAGLRGAQAGARYAEAFELRRWFL